MTILQFLTSPDGIALIGAVAGWLGVARWRKGRETQAEQIDRWAAAAVAAV